MKNCLDYFNEIEKRISNPILKNALIGLVALNLVIIGLGFKYTMLFPIGIIVDLLVIVQIYIQKDKIESNLNSLKNIFIKKENIDKKIKNLFENLGKRNFIEKIDNKDDAGEMHEYIELINNTVEDTKNIISKMQDLAIALGCASDNILSSSGEQATASAEQAAAVAEITATMEELAKTAAQIANNSDNLAKGASKTEAASSEGFNAVNYIINNIGVLKNKIDLIKDNAKKLGESSKEINKILNLITDIANETHLLALNAAIESVAAGEYGKRFGVVANEVRRLAERASESTGSIRHLLEDFQDSINATILSTEEGAKEVIRTVEIANSAIDSFSNIRKLVAQTHTATQEISIATQQQRTASEQIVYTLKDISKVSDEAAKTLNSSTASAKKLNELALKLQLLAQSFTIAKSNNLKYLLTNLAKKEEILNMNKVSQESELKTFCKRNPFIEAMYIADPDGYLTVFVVNQDINFNYDSVMGKSYSDRPWFTETRRKNVSWITDIYESALTQQTCFTVSVPINNDKNEVVGILAADINTRQWNQI